MPLRITTLAENTVTLGWSGLPAAARLAREFGDSFFNNAGIVTEWEF